MTRVHRDRQQGFSLIEVLVSLGLLAGVMVAVSSLFIFGGKEVKSGKQMTSAYSIGHDILEEMDRMTYTQAYMYFKPSAVNPDTATTYTVDSYTSGPPTSSYQANIDSKLYNGKASIKVEGIDTAGTAVALTSAIGLRVTVSVEWDEGVNHRYLNLRSVRF
jgi:prepilin-type N-terminal cleavage/methylation domain-containing protein